MKRLWWELEHALPYLGLPGLLGLALLLGAAVIEWGVRPPLEESRIEAENELSKLSLKPLRASAVAPEADTMDQFRSVAEVPVYLQKIMELAGKNGLTVPRGQYQAQRPEGGGLPLIRYSLTLPITGTYPAIRRFGEQVKQTIPGIALTQLSFTRESVQTPNVQANIEFTLWLKEAR